MRERGWNEVRERGGGGGGGGGMRERGWNEVRERGWDGVCAREKEGPVNRVADKYLSPHTLTHTRTSTLSMSLCCRGT